MYIDPSMQNLREVLSVQDIVDYWKNEVVLPEEIVPSQLADNSIRFSSSQTSVTCSLGSSDSSSQSSNNSSIQEYPVDSPRPSSLSPHTSPSNESSQLNESSPSLVSSPLNVYSPLNEPSVSSPSNTLQATAAVANDDGTDSDADDEIITEPTPFKLPNASNVKVSRAMELVKTGNVKYDEAKKIFLVFDTAWRVVSLFPEKCGCLDSPFLVFDTAWRVVSLFPEKCGCLDSPNCCHILAVKHKNGLELKLDYFKPKKLAELKSRNATNNKYKSGKIKDCLVGIKLNFFFRHLRVFYFKSLSPIFLGAW